LFCSYTDECPAQMTQRPLARGGAALDGKFAAGRILA